MNFFDEITLEGDFCLRCPYQDKIKWKCTKFDVKLETIPGDGCFREITKNKACKIISSTILHRIKNVIDRS